MFQRFTAYFASAAVLASLAACGGAEPGATALVPYSDHYSEFLGIQDSVSAPGTAGTALPVAGSADYSGAMSLSYLDNPLVITTAVTLAGAFQMSVDFANDTVSGSADDFSTPEGDFYAGTLVLGDSTTPALDRTTAIFQDSINTELNGTLTSPAGLDYETNASMSGSFLDGTDVVVLTGSGTFSTGGPDKTLLVGASAEIVP